MTTPLRTSGVTPYRRFIMRSVIQAFRDVFDTAYARDAQLADLKITQKAPLVKVDYPSLVIDYVDRRVFNAGVGHEEWFEDEGGVLRRWMHSRFEGALNIDIFALSPLDRDYMADALIDVLRFGRLDAELNKFFTDVYGSPDDPVIFQYEQLALNTDAIDGRGNTREAALWQPEDQAIYSTGYTLECHGGFYNTVGTDTFPIVTDVGVYPYLEGTTQPLSGSGFTNPDDPTP